MKKKRRLYKQKLGAEFVLISRRNRTHVDKKKENNKNKCRRKNEERFC